MVLIGVYWPRDEFDRTRAAFLADLESGDVSFPRSHTSWLVSALTAHVARNEHVRASLALSMPATTTTADRPGINRHLHIPEQLLADVDEARSGETGQPLSRSKFIRVAASAACEESEARAGGARPATPGVLPLGARRKLA